MNKDILTSLRPALVMTLLFALLLGVVYPLALTAIGQ
ncbi:MAG: potassium-transporting ATPase subunit C, partial [Pseudomonadota bacterium]|nr:potassium-transporting ATPase subunit C [Pseudomonadota bacterium]